MQRRQLSSDSAAITADGRTPVLRSLIEVGALARLLEEEYELREVQCRLIQATIRDTYRVDTATGFFILSIYRHGQRTAEEIGAELDIMAAAHEAGVRVPAPIPCSSGERLLTIKAPEGLRHAVLFTYVEGRQLSKNPEEAIVRRYGQAVARIHHVADALPRPMPRSRLGTEALLDRPLAAFASVVSRRPEVVAELREVVAALHPRISALPVESPGFGLIHGDVIPSNAQVTPEGEVTVLDFDFCGYGWRAYDIATYLWEVRFWGTSEAAAQAFLDGYRKERPLAGWEQEALALFVAARGLVALGTPALHADIWGSAYLSDRLIDNMLTRTRESLARIR